MGHDPRLDSVVIPAGFEDWFYRYFELRTGESLTFTELCAYQQVYNVKFTPIEVAAYMRMDAAAAKMTADIVKENSKK